MNEKPTINLNTLKPITKFIYTIGALPTSYLMSMSYPEQLTWLCNYIMQTLIPNLNENTEAVQELQELYELLRTYVNDYFDNLDVQQEINNKLEEMSNNGELTQLIKNYVDPLYQSYVDEINEEVESQNSEITNIRNIVTNVASGSPLVASSTSEMTDTTRIYVNTTDGKWYYYDGDSWEIGGTYQSSGIANKSIDVLQLNEDLQSNFFMDFSSPINEGNAYTGYYRNNGVLVDAANYVNYHVPLTNGETYVFSGQNYLNLATLLIKDNSDNIIYASNPNSETGYVGYMFTVKDNNLTAYVSRKTSYGTTVLVDYLYGNLRTLNTIYNQLKYTNSITPMLTLENKFLQAEILANESKKLFLAYSNYNDSTIKIYQMSKGRTYKINAWNWSNVCGICVMSLDLGTIIYASSTENIGNTHTATSYEFTANQNGYIIITEIDSTTYPISIEIINNGIDINVIVNNLKDKKIGIDGDSIINGSGNSNIGYCDIIAHRNNMTKSKYSVGGGTIATGTYSSDTPRHWICQSVLNIATDCDYVVVNGGFNDFSNSVPLGEMITSYTEEVDSDTFIGGMETLCRNLISRFPTKKLAFCTNHNINNSLFRKNSVNKTMQDYIDATYQVCKKYGIKVIDVGANTHFDTEITSLKNNYTNNQDGVHPNNSGYNYFYVDYVFNELNNL